MIHGSEEAEMLTEVRKCSPTDRLQSTFIRCSRKQTQCSTHTGDIHQVRACPSSRQMLHHGLVNPSVIREEENTEVELELTLKEKLLEWL